MSFIVVHDVSDSREQALSACVNRDLEAFLINNTCFRAVEKAGFAKNRIANNRIERPLSTALNQVFIKCRDNKFTCGAGRLALKFQNRHRLSLHLSVGLRDGLRRGARLIAGNKVGLKCVSSGGLCHRGDIQPPPPPDSRCVCARVRARACARRACVHAVCLHNRAKVSAKSPGKIGQQIDPKYEFHEISGHF